eukprot:1254611-Prymnesium_polylepis.2
MERRGLFIDFVATDRSSHIMTFCTPATSNFIAPTTVSKGVSQVDCRILAVRLVVLRRLAGDADEVYALRVRCAAQRGWATARGALLHSTPIHPPVGLLVATPKGRRV